MYRVPRPNLLPLVLLLRPYLTYPHCYSLNVPSSHLPSKPTPTSLPLLPSLIYSSWYSPSLFAPPYSSSSIPCFKTSCMPSHPFRPRLPDDYDHFEATFTDNYYTYNRAIYSVRGWGWKRRG